MIPLGGGKVAEHREEDGGDEEETGADPVLLAGQLAEGFAVSEMLGYPPKEDDVNEVTEGVDGGTNSELVVGEELDEAECACCHEREVEEGAKRHDPPQSHTFREEGLEDNTTRTEAREDTHTYR